MSKFREIFKFRSIKTKVIIAFVICGIFLLGATEYIISDTMTGLEEELISKKEASDILYLEDYLGDGQWMIVDNTLCKGNIKIGDGSSQKANILPFVELEAKTGTFFYSFIHADYVAADVKAEIDARISNRTNYIRAAGSTKGPNGESIVGTYMDKAVSDILDTQGTYSGEANVEGRAIYCLYKVLKNGDGDTVGAIVVGRSIEELKNESSRANIRAFIVIVIALLLATLVMILIISRWLKSLNKAKAYLLQIGTGEFPEEALTINTNDEMSQMADSINEMKKSLMEKERIGAELSLATDIQSNMLPSIFPPFPEHDEFSIYATMNSAKEVGGDFYDFFMLDDRNLAMVIADVSGKGVPAALFMVIAKTLIKNHAQSGLIPAQVFTKVNQMLSEGNEVGLFVTAWLGVINIETGKLTYVNAGHNPPMIALDGGGFEFLRARPGFVLAGMEGVRYRQASLTMKPGDKLFLYTDGVTEATSVQKELYGEARLSKYLNTHINDSVDKLLHGLRADINDFVGEADQFDDITMLIFDYQKYMDSDGMTETEFTASDENFREVIEFVEGELEKVECPPKTMMQISVAVEEIYINIAHYAYLGQKGKMKLGLRIQPGEAAIRFTDHGMPFNPLAKADPNIKAPTEERSVGGLGIYMVKKTMDDTQYKYENGQNIFTIVKKW